MHKKNSLQACTRHYTAVTDYTSNMAAVTVFRMMSLSPYVLHDLQSAYLRSKPFSRVPRFRLWYWSRARKISTGSPCLSTCSGIGTSPWVPFWSLSGPEDVEDWARNRTCIITARQEFRIGPPVVSTCNNSLTAFYIVNVHTSVFSVFFVVISV